MKFSHHGLRALILAACAAAPSVAHADITGFGNFSGFTVNQADGGSAPTVSSGAILLTHNAGSRSIFDNTPQSISAFTASFTYKETGGSTGNGALGACFVIQNSSAGVHTVAAIFNGGLGGDGRFGYGTPNNPHDFNNSMAISLEAGPSLTTLSSLYTGGVVGSSGSATTPVSFQSGDPINVTITYDGSLLQESLVDANTLASYSTGYLTNIPSFVGGSTALVGFTAGTQGAADQTISNFQFTSSVPEPASLSILALGGTLTLRRRRRMA